MQLFMLCAARVDQLYHGRQASEKIVLPYFFILCQDICDYIVSLL